MLKAYGGKRKGRYYQVNNDALQAFQRRRDSGMNLSQKLWNQAEDYKRGLEHTLSVAIEKGMSAVTLSKRVSKYLEDFPSMKKDYGERFGRATDIHDCEYRSIRLARSEINMAYRSAEQMRWEQMDFIIGYEVKLSGNHNCKGVPQGAFYDICDDLKGRYPKDFKWLGWHPNCRCYVVPIIKSEERFWEDEGKRGDDNEEITELPDNFKQWATQNKDRIARAEQRGTLPYFVRDNRERIKAVTRLQSNKMAIDKGSTLDMANLSAYEKNQIASSVLSLSNKTNLFPKNLKIAFNDNPTDGTLMAMNVSEGTLVISQARFNMGNGAVFSPAENLRDAIAKLKVGKPLSFNEEYAIECLFHESVHSKATKKINIEKGTQREAIMEASVQLYARDRYVRILNSYNVEPVNFSDIQINGYGYKHQVNAIRDLFTRDGKLQTGELVNIANETEDGIKIVNKKLKAKGYSQTDIFDFWKHFKITK